MRYEEIRDVMIDDLQGLEGRYTSAYQICRRLEELRPELWQRLVREYPGREGQPAMGESAGTPYSPATFVSHALDNIRRLEPRILKAHFDSAGVVFAGVEPGFRGGWLLIWAWDKSV
jgi:hypothetical protein